MLAGFSGVPIHKSGVNVDIAPGLIQLGGDGGRVTTLDMGILSLPLSPPLQPYLDHHTILCYTVSHRTIPYNTIPHDAIYHTKTIPHPNLSCYHCSPIVTR